MNFSDKILNYAKAAYPLLVINTHEEKRVVNDLQNILSKREEFGKFYKWECLNGLMEMTKDGKDYEYIKGTDAPDKMFEFLLHANERKERRSAYALCDFHMELESRTRAKEYIRYLRNLSNYLRRDGSTIIFVSPNFPIPTELEKDVQVVDYALPDAKAIKNKLEDILISANVALKAKKKDEVRLAEDFKDNIVEASKGMTVSEVEAALAFATICTGGSFNDEFIKLVFDEKIAQVKKNSLLAYIETDISFEQVGGLDGIKSWINLRKRVFSAEAQKYGLPNSKGLLLCGISGGGKTHISKAIANEFKVPLWNLDVGKLFGSKVGNKFCRVFKKLKIL